MELDLPSLLLTLEEAISLRLYTGPCFSPINEFLRETSKQSRRWRVRAARDATLTYAATVAHLCSAIRKLARVTACPARLYRGVRGELPAAFWLRDKFGEVTALDLALMSTSTSEAVSASFLGAAGDDEDRAYASNLMWEVHTRGEDGGGYHAGADVSRLSQFPEEAEILFPPLTMLMVHMKSVATGGAAASSTTPTSSGDGSAEERAVRTRVELQTDKGVRRYTKIMVTPTFT